MSKINTGAKYDSKAFQKSVGLNGVGTKAVNALSHYFKVTAIREGKEKTAEFERGVRVRSALLLRESSLVLTERILMRCLRCASVRSSISSLALLLRRFQTFIDIEYRKCNLCKIY